MMTVTGKWTRWSAKSATSSVRRSSCEFRRQCQAFLAARCMYPLFTNIHLPRRPQAISTVLHHNHRIMPPICCCAEEGTVAWSLQGFECPSRRQRSAATLHKDPHTLRSHTEIQSLLLPKPPRQPFSPFPYYVWKILISRRQESRFP